MTDTYAEDVYRELRTLIQVYAGLEPKEKWCASCEKTFKETVNEHLTRHLGAMFGWTSTPPPKFG